jgi:hypothetical protein
MGVVAAGWCLVAVMLANGIGALLLTRWNRKGMASYAPMARTGPNPQLIIPATGPLERLEELRAAILAQSRAPASTTFAVESRADPAFARIRAVFTESVTVVAGKASGGSQKTRNQAAALRAVPPGDCIVLADADILPQPSWLDHLVQPIANNRADIVTGYRWPIPTDAGPATLIGTWIDRGIAGLVKAADGRLLWGGSIAISRTAAAALDLPDLLERAITDDLAIAEAARGARLRTLFRGAVLVETPFGHGFRSLHAFGKRQYQLVRLYAPLFWWLALGITALNLVGTVTVLLLAMRSWIGTAAWAASVALALANARERRMQARAAGIVRTWNGTERLLLLLALVLPVVHLYHLVLIASGASVRTVRWGRYRYRLRNKHVVAVHEQ